MVSGRLRRSHDKRAAMPGGKVEKIGWESS
jgi:hypothetical protein